jgi:hypothetical protein
MDAKCVFPGCRNNVIAAAPTVRCDCGSKEDGVVLEAVVIAYTVKANVATVKGLSYV